MKPLCPSCGAQIFRPICDWCGELISQPSYSRTLIQSLSFFVHRHGLWIFIIVGLSVFGVAGYRMKNQQSISLTPKQGINPTNKYRSFGEPNSIVTQTLPPPRSLRNEKMLYQSKSNGNGKLIVENGTEFDAVIKVVDRSKERVIAAFYVRALHNGEVEKLEDGSFEIFFTLGTDWDSNSLKFRRNAQYSKFDGIAEFVTRMRIEGDSQVTETSVNRITLQKVVSGNATTSTVTESEFVKYK